MARPTKSRKVCYLPRNLDFIPSEYITDSDVITLTIDEYETIRLIDKVGISQEKCSQSMEVARTTVQKIYENARRKIATAIVEGIPLSIKGGDYLLCDGSSNKDECKNCYKHFYNSNYKKTNNNIARIAVTYDGGYVSRQFNNTKQLKIYDISDKKIIGTNIIDINFQGHCDLPGVLCALNTDVLVCGVIVECDINALKSENIKLFGGVSGDCDMVVNGYLLGFLNFNLNNNN